MGVSLDEYMSRRAKNVSGDTVFKGYIDKAGGGKYDKQGRSARFVMSTENPDREGDVIRQNGWKLDNFMKNAPLPVFHQTRSWPVGSWKDVEVKNARPKRLEGTAQLLPEGGPVPEVDQAAWMLEHGGIKAVSVGFIPLEMDFLDEERGWLGGFEIMSAELVECSLVPVPAHPDALIKAAAGDMVLAREFIEEVLDTYALCPSSGDLMSREDYEKAYMAVKRQGLPEIELIPKDKCPNFVFSNQNDLEAIAVAAERAESAMGRLKTFLGFKTPEIVAKEPEKAKTDEKTPPDDDLERGIARIVQNEALNRREAALIETLQAKGRL
jgi:HK97 family phage prohead protease